MKSVYLAYRRCHLKDMASFVCECTCCSVCTGLVQVLFKL